MDGAAHPGDKGAPLTAARTPMNRVFTILIVSAMVLGVAVGWAVNQYASPAGAKVVAENLSIVTDVFLRLIKMIIAPLVFSTLVAGIAHMEDSASIGRVGVKALGWFVTASVVSLTIGLIMVHLLHPGSGLSLPMPDPGKAATAVDMSKFTLKSFIPHIVPASIIQAMADNEILQIVVFSVFVGSAVAALDDKAPDATKLCAMAKRVATDRGFEIANDALQLHGGYGYLADYGIEKIVRDLRVHQILEGTNEIMRLIVSRKLIEGAR